MQVFNQARRTGTAAEKGDDYNWTQTNMRYRVGVLLPNRQKGGRVSPIFYYTTDLHEAKFLQVNINLYGDKYRNDRMKDVIRLGEKIEKATRLQKIMQLLVLAKEKRFVQMVSFQQTSSDLITIAQQSVEFGRVLAIKWFQSELDDVEQSVLPSAFRQVDPKKPKTNAETWKMLVSDEA
jgi:hypothetical protein